MKYANDVAFRAAQVVKKLRPVVSPLLVATLLLSFTIPTFSAPVTTVYTGPSPEFKPHQALWEANRHRSVPYRPARYQNLPLSPVIQDPGYVVYGYLPYWEISYDGFRWDQLTHVAYFAASLDSSGNITDSKQWFDSSVTNLIAEAHAHGVRVVLTVTNFDNAQIGQIVGTPAIRSKVVTKLLEMVQAQGADGVSIDFEFVPKEAKGNFVTFMTELTTAFHQAIPNSHVSYAGPSVDWSNAYDYKALASACDHVFIMAYGYHWAGSDPGPTSPLTSGTVWSKYNVAWTVDDYISKGGEEIRPHMIAGLPLYGRDWQSTNDQIPGKKLANGVAVTYDQALVDGPKKGWKWDPASQCPYYVHQDGGTWHQTWVDTAASLALKFDLAKQKQLAGVGFWALGYDGTDDEIWAEVAKRYPPKIPEIIEDTDAGVPEDTNTDTDNADAGGTGLDADNAGGGDVGGHADAGSGGNSDSGFVPEGDGATDAGVSEVSVGGGSFYIPSTRTGRSGPDTSGGYVGGNSFVPDDITTSIKPSTEADGCAANRPVGSHCFGVGSFLLLVLLIGAKYLKLAFKLPI